MNECNKYMCICRVMNETTKYIINERIQWIYVCRLMNETTQYILVMNE